MLKEYGHKQYQAYMFLVNKVIADTKRMIDKLPQYEKVSKLSYEEWIEFQKREKIG